MAEKWENIMRVTKIGVLTGGGDCAGLNPAIKWVVKTALDNRLEKERGIKYEVLGIREGWSGLISPWIEGAMNAQYITPLNEDLVRTWDRFGGTLLGSSRINPYDPKNNRSALVIENIERLGLDAMLEQRGHMNKRSRPCFLLIGTQPERGFALDEVENRRHRRRVRGKLLAGGKAKGDHLAAVVILQRPAQDAVLRDCHLLENIFNQYILIHSVHISIVDQPPRYGSDLCHIPT